MGCDPGKPVNKAGITPLHLAAKLKFVDVVEVLCNAGADPHQPAEHGPSALSIALGQEDYKCFTVLAKHFVASHQEDGDRPLSEFEVMRAAISRGSPTFLEGFLSESKLKVTEQAVVYCAREGTGATMEVLLRHGGSANSIERGQHAIPAVVLSAALGNAACLKALLSVESSKEVNLDEECLALTPLMHAAREGHLDCVRILVEKGAQVNKSKSTSGWTALFFAANKGRIKVAEV